MIENKVYRQIRIWQMYSVFAPAMFLAVAGILTLIFGAKFEYLFWIGMVVFGVTCVAWWHWSLATMLNMLDVIKNADEHFNRLNDQLVIMRRELLKISNQKPLH